MAIAYRPAREDELEHAEGLVVRSINELTQRHGFGPMASLRPPHFQLFSFNDDPDGLWVAEDSGQILGFAFSWVCGELWFLAELFVSPDQQGRGIGNELLQRTFEHARKKGAATKALITFAFNTVSQALYIRHGLLPRTPIYFMKVPRDALAPPLADRLHNGELRCEPLRHTDSDLQSLAQIDAAVLGISRGKHHKYLGNDSAMKGVLLYAGGDCAGYAYVNADGHIGPMAVAQRHCVGAAFRTVLDFAAASGAPHLSAFIPGTSDALPIAIENGMRITFPMLLMATREFGVWGQYLPRNPGFM